MAEYAFAVRVFDLPEEMLTVSTFAVVEDRLFAIGWWFNRLYSVDLRGENLQATELLLSSSENGARLVIGPRQGADGELWFLLQTYDHPPTNGETRPNYQATLYRLDVDGTVEVLPLTSFDGREPIHDMTLDAAGNIYLLTFDGATIVSIYASDDLTRLGEVRRVGWDFSLLRVGDHVYLGGRGDAVHRVDPLALELGVPVALYTHGVTHSGLDGRIYYTAGPYLYSQDPGGGPARLELSWMDADIAPDSVEGLLALEDGTLVVSLLDRQIAVLTRIDPDAVPERLELILATAGPGADLEEAVARFNREQADYRIEIRDYSVYNTGLDWAAGLRRLQEDLLAGAGIDLVDLTGLSPDRLLAQEVLRDLTPFLDADEALGREVFVPQVLEALEVEGALPMLPASFYLVTLVGGPAHSDLRGWEMEAFLDYAEVLPPGVWPISPPMSGMGLFQFFVMHNWSTLMDDRGFEEAWFVRLLEYAAAFDERNNVPMPEGDRDIPPLEFLRVAGFEMLQLYTAHFGELVIAGFPAEADSAFGLGRSVGIPAASAAPEGAWAFLREFIGQETVWGLPVVQAALEERIADALASEEVQSWGIGGLIVDVGPITQADVDWVLELIAATQTIASLDGVLWKVIEEEAEAFFTGAQSAQAAAAAMAERIQEMRSPYGGRT